LTLPEEPDCPASRWALVELGDHEAIDVSVRKRNALKALEDAVYQGWVRRSAALTSDEFG
jgi:hypothetical protein